MSCQVTWELSLLQARDGKPLGSRLSLIQAHRGELLGKATNMGLVASLVQCCVMYLEGLLLCIHLRVLSLSCWVIELFMLYGTYHIIIFGKCAIALCIYLASANGRL